MAQLETFFAMGGYGAFVWSAFAVTALVMGWMLIATVRRLRGLERKLSEARRPPPSGAERAA